MSASRRMSWERWEGLWRLHAQGSVFARRVERAIEIIHRAVPRTQRLYVSVSGGKDSVALAGLVEEAGYAGDVEFAHAHSAILAMPESIATCDGLAEVLDLEYQLVEPSGAGVAMAIRQTCEKFGTPPPQRLDEWGILDAMPDTVDISDRIGWLWRYLSCASMLRDWSYEQGFDGYFMGLRADESRARRDYLKFRGALYRSPTDGMLQVCPLARWSATDVLAYIHNRELPLHPYYRRAYETCCWIEAPEDSRVGELIASGVAAQRGAWVPVSKCYPEQWHRITRARPELALCV